MDLSNFFREQRQGKYEACKYPNLVEIYEYFPTGYFANVTDELMLAVFRGEEDLTTMEMLAIARYNGIPFSVLTCPKLITLSRERYRHQELMNQLRDKFYKIWELEKSGSKHAQDYMATYSILYRDDYERMNFAFCNGRKVTYGHYLGVRHRMDDTILFSQNEFKKEPRGLKKKGGAAA